MGSAGRAEELLLSAPGRGSFGNGGQLLPGRGSLGSGGWSWSASDSETSPSSSDELCDGEGEPSLGEVTVSSASLGELVDSLGFGSLLLASSAGGIALGVWSASFRSASGDVSCWGVAFAFSMRSSGTTGGAGDSVSAGVDMVM